MTQQKNEAVSNAINIEQEKAKEEIEALKKLEEEEDIEQNKVLEETKEALKDKETQYKSAMNEIELFKLEQLESQRKIGLYEDEDKEGYRPVQNFKYALSEKVNPTNAYKNLFMKLHKSSNWEHSNSYKIEIDHKETSNPHMFGGKIELDGFTSNHIFSSEVKPGLIHKITADENKTTIAFFKYEVNQGYSFHSNPLLIFKSPKEDLNIIKNKTELTFRKKSFGRIWFRI